MRDGNPQQTASVHLPHLGEKFEPVIRPSLQDVKLPLMNHFVGQGAQQLLLGVGGPGGELLEQRQGQTDVAALLSLIFAVPRVGTRAHQAHKHADRRGQTAAPPHLDRRELTVEIALVQFVPTNVKPFTRARRGGCLHGCGESLFSQAPVSSSKIEAANSGTMIS